jgi:hypothetical protein
VPRDAVDGVDLDAYVATAVELSLGREPRRAVLARRRLDERSWLNIEKTWLLRVATAALAGDHSLLAAHDEATVRAQDAAVARSGPIPVEVYAGIVAEVETGGELSAALARRRVNAVVFGASARHWTRVHASNEATFHAFRALVAADAVRR